MDVDAPEAPGKPVAPPAPKKSKVAVAKTPLAEEDAEPTAASPVNKKNLGARAAGTKAAPSSGGAERPVKKVPQADIETEAEKAGATKRRKREDREKAAESGADGAAAKPDKKKKKVAEDAAGDDATAPTAPKRPRTANKPIIAKRYRRTNHFLTTAKEELPSHTARAIREGAEIRAKTESNPEPVELTQTEGLKVLRSALYDDRASVPLSRQAEITKRDYAEVYEKFATAIESGQEGLLVLVDPYDKTSGGPGPKNITVCASLRMEKLLSRLPQDVSQDLDRIRKLAVGADYDASDSSMTDLIAMSAQRVLEDSRRAIDNEGRAEEWKYVVKKPRARGFAAKKQEGEEDEAGSDGAASKKPEADEASSEDSE